MTRNIRDEILMWEELARRRNIIKQSFLKDREQRQVRDEQISRQAKPIVEAIAKTKADIVDQSKLSSDELQEYVEMVKHYNVPKMTRGEQVKAIQEMYPNEQLFNVFLTMVQTDRIEKFGPEIMAWKSKFSYFLWWWWYKP